MTIHFISIRQVTAVFTEQENETISVQIAAGRSAGRPKSTHSNFGKWVLDTQFAVMKSSRPGSWSRGASRTKMKSWSWSRSWRKCLAVFQYFCCNSWRQWVRHTMAFCERQQKQFAIRKPNRLFERTFCVPCTSASVERVVRVFNNGGYLLGHTYASKAQCINCENCFYSVAINRESKLFTGWNVI